MDKVWTVYKMACFLSLLVVDVPVIMLFFLFFRPVLLQRQVLAVLVQFPRGFSSL